MRQVRHQNATQTWDKGKVGQVLRGFWRRLVCTREGVACVQEMASQRERDGDEGKGKHM